MTPSLPPIQMSDATSSKGGSIGGNTVNFGGFGIGAGGGGLMQYWPLLAGVAVLLIIARKR